MDKEKIKQTIKFCFAVVVIVVILAVVGTIIMKYEVEGDQNMPFVLSKIMVVSTAEGQEAEGDNKWNFSVYQNNDVYIYIDKNEEYYGESTYIEAVKFENIQIVETPEIGEIKTYMPNSVEGRLFSYEDSYIVEDSLTYSGATQTNYQTLEIGNQGGSALLEFSNVAVGEYSSDDDEEIIHDGTLLEKLDVTEEQVQFKVSFDLVIEMPDYSYRATVMLELPCENMIEEGTSSLEITDTTDIIFKRES